MNDIQKDFVIINHTADVGIEAYGKTPEEIFVNMAKGMFSLITDTENVSEEICFNVDIKGEDRESLLINWLNELIYLYDAENVVFKRFEIKNLSEAEIKTVVYGEKINLDKHVLDTQIKAATYHMLEFKCNQTCKARVIFDV